jgi:hypothetical protein
MCFGGGSDKSSREMINLQKQEAAAAAQKEAERQARIASGLQRIKQTFHGAPVMKAGTGTYKFAAPGAGTKVGAGVSGLPPGYTYVRAPATAAAAAPRATSAGYVGGHDAVQPGGGATGGLNPAFSASSNSGGGYQYGGAGSTRGGGGGVGAWQIRGPDGRLYNVGENVVYGTQVPTGQTTGGIGDEFYDKFKQGMLDYYMPQVAEKFGDAQKETLYRLARAGTLKSTMTNDELANLTKQNLNQEGVVKTQADTAAADLRKRTAQEEQNAVNQLYSTENPDVAANTALASVRNITAETPNLTPLGDIFDIATIGTANALKGAMGSKLGRTYVPGYKGATKTVQA